MKKEELLRALGDIREDFIEDAAPDMSQRARLKAGRWRRAAGAAAAFLVLLIGTGVFYRMQNAGKLNTAPMEAVEDTAPAQADNAAADTPTGPAPAQSTLENAAQSGEKGQEAEAAKDAAAEGAREAAEAPVEEAAEAVPEDAAYELTGDAGAAAQTTPEAGLKEEMLMAEEAAEVAGEAAEEPAELAAEAAPEDDAGLIVCVDLAEAEEIAGFSLQLPEAIEGEINCRAAAGTLIECDYTGTEEGAKNLLIRKGTDQDAVQADFDLSGSGAKAQTVFAGGQTIRLQIRDGDVLAAAWESGGMAYLVSCGEEALAREEMLDLIAQIH